jgi:hypothetical protein
MLHHKQHTAQAVRDFFHMVIKKKSFQVHALIPLQQI